MVELSHLELLSLPFAVLRLASSLRKARTRSADTAKTAKTEIVAVPSVDKPEDPCGVFFGFIID